MENLYIHILRNVHNITSFCSLLFFVPFHLFAPGLGYFLHSLLLSLLCPNVLFHPGIHNFVRSLNSSRSSNFLTSRVLLSNYIRHLLLRLSLGFLVQSKAELLTYQWFQVKFSYCFICFAFSLSLTSALSSTASIFFLAFSSFFKARFFFLALASKTFLIGRTLISSNFFL